MIVHKQCEVVVVREDYTKVEKYLRSYKDMNDRIEAMSRDMEQTSLMGIALRMGPSAAMVQDVSKPRVTTSAPQSWELKFESAIAKKEKMIKDVADEVAECVDIMTKIRTTVRKAGLTDKQRVLVDYRYFLGYSVDQVRDAMGGINESISEAKYKKLRLEVLEKVKKVTNL